MAVPNNDMLLYKEFCQMMNGRRGLYANNPQFRITEIPMPQIATMLQQPPGGTIALVRKLKEPYFEKLNNTEVAVLPKTTLLKRQVGLDGKFMRDTKGKYVTVQVPVKQGSVAISSPIKIGLRNSVVNKVGQTVPYKPSDGFKYVDFIKNNGQVRYVYIVPKQYIYRLNLCALILTPNKHRAYFNGCRLAMQSGNYMYMYVIPYKNRSEYTSYRILGIKASPDFSQEVNAILQFWQEVGVVFNFALTNIDASIKGINNLAYVPMDGTLPIEDYVRFGKSMADDETMEEVVF